MPASAVLVLVAIALALAVVARMRLAFAGVSPVFLAATVLLIVFEVLLATLLATPQ